MILPEKDYTEDGRCTFRQEVKHCIGLDYPERGRHLYHRHGKAYWKAWRNFFDAGRRDDNWEELVKLGYAIGREYGAIGVGMCYHLTDKGLAWLGQELNITIKLET